MDRLASFARIVILLSIAVLLLGGLLIMLGPERIAAWLPRRPLPEMDLRALPADKPGVLACTPGLCADGTIDIAVEPIALPAKELRARLLAFVDRSPEIALVDIAPDGWQWRFRVSMPEEAVPDVVVVRLKPEAEARTAIAVYSRAMGWSAARDRQVRRVRRWLAILKP